MLHNKKIACAMAFVMFATLIALGVWQLQRLEWKEALLAKIETRLALPAEPLPEKIEDPEAWEYRRVKVTGAFQHARFLIQPRTHNGRVGYHMVMPVRIKSGGIIYVNRGWVSDKELPDVKTGGRFLRLEGVLQIPYQGYFTPDNNIEKNTWYWPDLAAMEKQSEQKSDYPMILTLLPQPAGVYPMGYEVTAYLNNNHKLYAMFWFGMALVLVVVFVISQKKQENA